MEEIRITYQELIYYVAGVNLILGVLFGSLPLIAGFVLKNRKYGLLGFLSSIIGGAILGILLSYLIAAIFIWLIVRSPKPTDTTVENVDSE